LNQQPKVAILSAAGLFFSMEQAVLCHEDQLQQRGEIAFGFVRMENGATIFLEAAWALNVKDSREAATTLCGTKAQRTKARSCFLQLFSGIWFIKDTGRLF
jgi:hypothetical protein